MDEQTMLHGLFFTALGLSSGQIARQLGCSISEVRQLREELAQACIDPQKHATIPPHNTAFSVIELITGPPHGVELHGFMTSSAAIIMPNILSLFEEKHGPDIQPLVKAVLAAGDWFDETPLSKLDQAALLEVVARWPEYAKRLPRAQTLPLLAELGQKVELRHPLPIIAAAARAGVLHLYAFEHPYPRLSESQLAIRGFSPEPTGLSQVTSDMNIMTAVQVALKAMRPEVEQGRIYTGSDLAVLINNHFDDIMEALRTGPRPQLPAWIQIWLAHPLRRHPDLLTARDKQVMREVARGANPTPEEYDDLPEVMKRLSMVLKAHKIQHACFWAVLGGLIELPAP